VSIIDAMALQLMISYRNVLVKVYPLVSFFYNSFLVFTSLI